MATRNPAAPEVTSSISQETAPPKIEAEAATLRKPVYRAPQARSNEVEPMRRSADAPGIFFPFALFLQPLQP
jgi:hypothetical protein